MAPALRDFVDQWLEDNFFDHARACLLLLAEKRHGQLRDDGYTPAILHELSQACYTISLIEAGYPIADPEALLCLNLTHDLGEEFAIKKGDLCRHFQQHVQGIPEILQPWQERTSLLFSRMAKKINNTTLFPTGDGSGKIDHKAYFLSMLEHPLTAIAKFQDRIHNMATMIGVKSFEKQKEYLEETILLRSILTMAKGKFPQHNQVLGVMHNIITAQIFFTNEYLNIIDPANPKKISFDSLPRLHRVKALPEGLDPLMITQKRAAQAIAERIALQSSSLKGIAIPLQL